MSRPTKIETLTDLNFYWLKKELAQFCKQKNISTSGQKEDLLNHIKTFFKTGKIVKETKTKTLKSRDSDKELTLNTPVVNYKNDLKTRIFFEKEIGKKFHFTVQLMDYIKESFAKGKKLTYSDLVNEWNAEFERRKNPNYKTKISKSCQYNQFTRDWFTKNPKSTRKEVLKAWEKFKKNISI